MFYTPYVDISSPKSMWTFLHDHFQYYTMNSWNGNKSIANKVKLYNLNLEGDYSAALKFLFDESDIGDLQFLIGEQCGEFNLSHPGYTVGFNGRSGGYLVLYSTDHNCSVLPDCVDNYDSWEDFKADCKDYGEKVSDYTYELRELTKVVRDFDRLCDSLRDLVNEYSKMNYEDQVLAANIEHFNIIYESDLDLIGASPLEVLSGEVDVSSILKLTSLTEALVHLFGRNRVEIINNKLKVKEN